MKYWAFISYNSKDRNAATKLHRALETYKLPPHLVGHSGVDGTVPPNLKPVFIDRSELRGASSLDGEIVPALKESRTLIVLCSRSAAVSSYIDQEVREFQSMGRHDRIFPVVVDAGPRGIVKDSFPSALRRVRNPDGSISEIEPLAADLKKDGFNNTKLKLIAGILGLDFDALKQRDRIRRRQQVLWQSAMTLLAILAVSLGYIGMVDRGAPGSYWAGDTIRHLLDRHDMSVFRPAASTADIAVTLEEVRREWIRFSLAEFDKPGEVLTFRPDGKVGGAWILGQHLSGVAGASEATPDDLRRAKRWMNLPFEPGRAVGVVDGVNYGWLWFRLEYPQAENALWPIIALSEFLVRPDALTQEERARFLKNLRFAQEAASLYYGDGGWMHLPNQINRNELGLYTTIIGLETLLAVRKTGEDWPGHDLHQMIGATSDYLLRTYDPAPEGHDAPGWRGTQVRPEVSPNPSLTLLAYAALLRAAQAEPDLVTIPPEMLAHIAARVAEFDADSLRITTMDLDHFRTPFVDSDGKEKPGEITWQFLRYPYAIACAQAWHDHLQRSGADPSDVVAARRALGKLISHTKEMGQARGDFYRAEGLWILNRIK